MNLNKFTEKAQEAMFAAQSLAEEHNHSAVEVEHLLLALVRQEGGVVPEILGALDVPVRRVVGDLEGVLARKPTVSGPAQRYVSPGLAAVVRAAQGEAERLHDEYVSTEHLLLAI